LTQISSPVTIVFTFNSIDMKKQFTETTWRKDKRFILLCKALNACKTESDVANLLRDIGTLSELQAWSERLDAAQQIAQGLPYRTIAENTGTSTTTVTRVASFITSGTGGYKNALNIISGSHHHHATNPLVKSG